MLDKVRMHNIFLRIPSSIYLVELRNFFLTFDVSIKISADFKSVPFEKMINEFGENIRLFRDKKILNLGEDFNK